MRPLEASRYEASGRPGSRQRREEGANSRHSPIFLLTMLYTIICSNIGNSLLDIVTNVDYSLIDSIGMQEVELWKY